MKNLTFLFIAIIISFHSFSQITENNSTQNKLIVKSVEYEMQENLLADSIITFHFTTPTDSFVYQKQFNRYNEATQTNYYESWTWDSYNQDWSKYLAETVKNTSSEYITTWISTSIWNSDSNKYIPSGQSESMISENYDGYIYRSYDAEKKTFVAQRKTENWINIYENDSLKFESNLNQSSGELEYKSKSSYSYDSLQNKIQELKFVWENNAWKANYKIEYTYDSLSNLLSINQFMLLYENFYNNVRYLFTYDSLNNRVNERLLLFNNNQWTNERNQTYGYDEMKRNISIVEEKWNTTNNIWVNERKTLMEYLGDENSATVELIFPIKTTILNWNTTSETWIPKSESSMIRNDIGYAEESLQKQWDTGSESWTNFYKTISNWNTEHRILFSQSTYGKSSEAADWITYSKTYHYYNGINVFQNISNVPDNQITIYPNPAKTQVHILQQSQKNLQLVVYNFSGQIVKQKLLNQTFNTLNISELNSGQYIFNISDGKSFKSFKIIKTD